MATRCHSLSFVVTRCHWLYHSLLLVLPLVVIRSQSLSCVVTRCTTCCYSLSLVVIRFNTRLSFYKRSLFTEKHTIFIEQPTIYLIFTQMIWPTIFFFKMRNVRPCKYSRPCIFRSN